MCNECVRISLPGGSDVIVALRQRKVNYMKYNITPPEHQTRQYCLLRFFFDFKVSKKWNKNVPL